MAQRGNEATLWVRHQPVFAVMLEITEHGLGLGTRACETDPLPCVGVLRGVLELLATRDERRPINRITPESGPRSSSDLHIESRWIEYVPMPRPTCAHEHNTRTPHTPRTQHAQHTPSDIHTDTHAPPHSARTHTHTYNTIHTSYTHTPVEVRQRGQLCVGSPCMHHVVILAMPPHGRCCCCQWAHVRRARGQQRSGVA